MSNKPKPVAVLVRVDRELYFQLRDYVQLHFSSRNKLINEAIRRYIGKKSG